jgi:hypothetical protein
MREGATDTVFGRRVKLDRNAFLNRLSHVQFVSGAPLITPSSTPLFYPTKPSIPAIERKSVKQLLIELSEAHLQEMEKKGLLPKDK